VVYKLPEYTYTPLKCEKKLLMVLTDLKGNEKFPKFFSYD